MQSSLLPSFDLNKIQYYKVLLYIASGTNYNSLTDMFDISDKVNFGYSCIICLLLWIEDPPLLFGYIDFQKMQIFMPHNYII